MANSSAVVGYANPDCEQLGRDGTQDGYQYGGPDRCLFSGTPGDPVKSIQLQGCSESSSNSSEDWTIADTVGTAVSAVIAILTLAASVFYWFRRRRRKRQAKEQGGESGSDTELQVQNPATAVVDAPPTHAHGGMQEDARVVEQSS